jgi:anaerobic ribonucleoside-triphosphate reductase
MINKIRKRDGSVVLFDKDKITEAIWKAVKAVGGDDRKKAEYLCEIVLKKMEEKFSENEIPGVEEIQDLVETTLIKQGHDQTAKAYILYRKSHDELRNVKGLFDTIEVVDDYVGLNDWMVKENSNMGFSLQGLNNYIATKIITNYWVRRIYPEAIRLTHEAADIHIHDLGTLGAYCVGWDLKDLLITGFKGVSGKVRSKPPKHLRTACAQMVNFFYTLQGETAGAQAFSNFDSLLAPFIRYDNLDYKEVKQIMQEFLFGLAVPTRVGFQTPFTNITMDLECPEYMKNEPVIIGGVPQSEKYGEFSKEMDMLNMAFAECMLEGDADGRVFTFPIPTYNITKEFDWDNPKLDLVWEMTAKYGIPYFSNFVNSDMKPEDARSMCPLAANEKVLIKSSRGRNLEYSEIGNIFRGNKKGEEYEIYSEGKFVEGKFNKFPNQKMIKVTLENNHEIKMSKEHLNFVLKRKNEKIKILKGEELNKEMYLPYSLTKYKGNGGNREMGFFVGAYAGDGSFDGETSVVFSLENNYKKDLIKKLKKISENHFGANCSISKSSKSKLVTLKVHSKAAVGLCKDFVEGIKREKHYKARLFGTSLDFREGVLEGHYATDGGNRNRIYTSSKKMVETINMLAATLGTTTCIYKDERKGRFGTEPNYAVLIYKLNRNNYGKIWFKQGDKLWMKIKEVENISNNSAYCFEVKGNKPIFTVGTSGILTHNCRLRLDQKELRKRGGGLFGANPQTGSIGVVTINMPRIGFTSGTEKEFLEKLGRLMEIAKESLEIKRKSIERFTELGLYPYSKFYLRQVYQRFGQYWKNHFSTIGLLGMNEAIMNFMPGEDITTPKGREFSERVLDYMREKLEEYQKETGNIYNLEATPGEGTSYRFARADKKRFGRIIVANERAFRDSEANPYYTNSTQLPVKFTDDIFEALDLQDPLQTKYTGGTVFHTFVGEKINKEAVKKIVKKISANYHLPYFTITPTFSICPKHGYLHGAHEYCPKCDQERENVLEEKIKLEVENGTKNKV